MISLARIAVMVAACSGCPPRGSDDFDEVVQRVAVAAWEAGRDGAAWLRGVARHKIGDVLAERSRTAAEVERPDPGLARHEAGVDPAMLGPLIFSLPTGQRAAAMLTWVKGMSHADAARALGVSVRTLGRRLQNARKRARLLV